MMGEGGVLWRVGGAEEGKPRLLFLLCVQCSQRVSDKREGFCVNSDPRVPDPGTPAPPASQVESAFEWLPLAAVVAGVVLVLHGGIGSQGQPPARRPGEPAQAPGQAWGVADIAKVRLASGPEREGGVGTARGGKELRG